MKILLIDNYDSFTYNLFHYLSSLKTKVQVYRNDKINTPDIIKKGFDRIVISPGPGNPNQSGPKTTPSSKHIHRPCIFTAGLAVIFSGAHLSRAFIECLLRARSTDTRRWM